MSQNLSDMRMSQLISGSQGLGTASLGMDAKNNRASLPADELLDDKSNFDQVIQRFGSPDNRFPSLYAEKDPKPDLHLDLSFGDTPMEFQKVNLLGSRLQQAAIYSLVLSLQTITYLDIRGNNLDSNFGWRLIKAMKKKYLQLEFCNGVNVRALRENTIDKLNLAGFDGHSGLYGIEVVGAIFLAHFLRLNSSLKAFNFRRNDVQKDGAKALAQALIGNTGSKVASINTMQIDTKTRTGIDFRDFRNNQVKEVNLPKCNLDDDDVVFLEEWLLRHDCATDLNLSNNPFYGEGVRKLHRYVLNTKTLLKLNLNGVPLDLDGVSLMAKAIASNTTLVQASFPVKACLGIQKEKQVVMHSLAVGLAKHPSLSTFGITPLRIGSMKEDKMSDINVDRIYASPSKAEVALFFWLLAVLCPSSAGEFRYGSYKAELGASEFPVPQPYPVSFCPPLNNLLHEMRNTLVKIQLSIPTNMDGLVVQIMRHLRSSSSLKDLKLVGFAAATISEISPDWANDGRLPTWIKEKLGSHRLHWQSLQSFLGECIGLEQFNNVQLSNYDHDSAERALLLLLECIDGIQCQLGQGDADSSHISLSFTCHRSNLDLPFALDVFRLVDKLIYDIDVHFLDKKKLNIEKRQIEFAKYFKENEGNKSIPPFVHNLRIQSQSTAKELILFAKDGPLIREFGLERIETVLPELCEIFRAPNTKQEIERIRIDRKWLITRRIPKLFTEKQREQLLKLQQGLANNAVQDFEILSSALGKINRTTIIQQTLTDFGKTLSCIQHDTSSAHNHQVYGPQLYIPCVTTPSEYYYSTSSGGRLDHTTGCFYPDDLGGNVPLMFELPTLDPSLHLRKVSLCQVGLKKLIANMIRVDEWPSVSKCLWSDIRCTFQPGQHYIDDEIDGGRSKLHEIPFNRDEQDPNQAQRFHWNSAIKLGDQSTLELAKNENPNFEIEFFHACLESLLLGCPSLISLDIRGNGLDKQDSLYIISLLERNTTLVTLNEIPVIVDHAVDLSELVFDSHGIPVVNTGLDTQNSHTENDNVDEQNCIYATSAFSGAGVSDKIIYGGNKLDHHYTESNHYIQLDEGDGYLFASLVTSTNFPNLKKVKITEHSIADSTLAYICDALLALPTLEDLEFSKISLSNRGANLLLSAITEIGGRLQSVNGIPLSRLIQEKKGMLAQGQDALKGQILAQNIIWNDFSLGLLSRLKLWPGVVWPDNMENFEMEGHTLTDVGVRGLCGLIKQFTTVPERPPDSGKNLASNLSFNLPNITNLDLSRNPQLTDAAVAVLCKALQTPNTCPKLGRLTVRYCPKLRARSAFELYTLIRQKVDSHEAGMDVISVAQEKIDNFLKSLKIVNGIDIGTLANFQSLGRPLPPCVIRIDIEEAFGSTILSECDSHFFAHIFHIFPAIPHVHVHLVVSGEENDPEEMEKIITQRNPNGYTSRHAGVHLQMVSNSTPFPAPRKATSKLEKELKTIIKFFQACPVSMKIQLSIIPKIAAEKGLKIRDDGNILLMQNLGDLETVHKATQKILVNNTGPAGIFGHLVERLVRKKKKGIKKKWEEQNQHLPDEKKTPFPIAQKPLYVNNINSQRMHDVYRTLYGNDDVHLNHSDIYSDNVSHHRQALPRVDDDVLAALLTCVSSLDFQHLFIRDSPLSFDLLPIATKHAPHERLDLSALTHINFAHNSLGDLGCVDMFNSLVKCGSTIVHVNVRSNSLSDVAAISIAHSMQSLPRLSSINLSENMIHESGCLALAESIGGTELTNSEHDTSLLSMLSVDLGSNRVREMGALRFAELVAMHPTLQFLNLMDNEIALRSDEAMSALIYAAAASSALAVLDLRDNFANKGSLPAEYTARLLAEPLKDFDPLEVAEGVFIKRAGKNDR